MMSNLSLFLIGFAIGALIGEARRIRRQVAHLEDSLEAHIELTELRRTNPHLRSCVKVVPASLLEDFIADLKREYEHVAGDSSIGYHIAEDLELLVEAATVTSDVW